MESHLRQPSAAPDPVCFNRIDQSRNDAGVNAVGQELRPLCHSAGHDRRCGRTKHQVKYKVGPVKIRIICKNIKTRLTDQPHHVLSQKKAETNQDKHDCSNTEVHQVLHQNVTCILSPGKACLHHSKPCLHPEHQCSADQKPDTEQLAVYSTHNFFRHNNSLLNETRGNDAFFESTIAPLSYMIMLYRKN